MISLPQCCHRGRELRPGFVECASNRLTHLTDDGLAPTATCLHPCPYANKPNRADIPTPHPDEPCAHRGALIETRPCDLCGMKGQPFEVLACALHGECSLTRKHSQVRSCAACLDWKPQA